MSDVALLEQDVVTLVSVDNDHVVSVDRAELHVVSAGEQGPPGGRGPIGPAGGSAITMTAAVALGGQRLVASNDAGEAIYASSDDLAHMNRVVGMTLGAALQGASVDVQRSGAVTEPSWNWALNTPVFLGTNGLLTQSPSSTGFLLIVGFPITATKLYLSFREPITLN